MPKFSVKSSELKMSKPTISVVMSVYNGERYLREAIESILNQSFSDFEFIIINDGSTDKTEEIIESFKDVRIIYIKNPSNLGLSKSFNIGIRQARGQYIARMDADDTSEPDRFEKQLDYLNKNEEVGIIGSVVTLIDERGRRLKKQNRPAEHIKIKWHSLFSTPLIHPTVMARANILKDNPYDETLTNSEDYELWSRLLFVTNTRLANLREPLLLYRVYKNSFTQKLDLNKRINSANNTIANIERYTLLSEHGKNALIFLRQDQPLSLSSLGTIWMIYLRAAKAFCRIEKLGLGSMLDVYSKMFSLLSFLAKYKIKQMIK